MFRNLHDLLGTLGWSHKSIPPPDLKKTVNFAAQRHRPRGFSAVLQREDRTYTVTISYCWKDSPRFDVRSEILMVADEVIEALQKHSPARTGPVTYVADHVVRFQVIPADNTSDDWL